MEIPIAQIAEILGAELIGDGSVTISNINGIHEAESGDLTFLIDPKYISALPHTKASAVLIRADIQIETSIPQIRVNDPQEAIQKLTQAFAPPPVEFSPGVHPTAIIAPDAVLGDSVSVQPYAVIEPGATIGNNVVIGAYSYVGHFTSIGDDSRLYPHVTIRERVSIGNRCILHPGVVIGADGFGYQQIEGKNIKIPQIGTVIIEDDVEIGANSCIDRARFDKTIVHRGAKIDNLVMVAHNCEVGEDSILCGCSGLSGSCKIGKNVILAGQVGVVGHVKICDNVIVGAQGGVSKDLTTPGFYIGSPATPHMTYKKRESVVVRLPELHKKLKELEKRIEQLSTSRKS